MLEKLSRYWETTRLWVVISTTWETTTKKLTPEQVRSMGDRNTGNKTNSKSQSSLVLLTLKLPNTEERKNLVTISDFIAKKWSPALVRISLLQWSFCQNIFCNVTKEINVGMILNDNTYAFNSRWNNLTRFEDENVFVYQEKIINFSSSRQEWNMKLFL